jgi:hypothetical protein
MKNIQQVVKVATTSIAIEKLVTKRSGANDVQTNPNLLTRPVLFYFLMLRGNEVQDLCRSARVLTEKQKCMFSSTLKFKNNAFVESVLFFTFTVNCAPTFHCPLCHQILDARV